MAGDRARAGEAVRGWRVCVLTDQGLARGRSHVQIVEAALAGGADAIQFREKRAGGHELYEIAHALRALTRAANVPLVVNDRVDVALAVEADAVHVGQRDLPARVVRKMIGGMLMGVSASNAEEARRARDDGADYLGVGPIFEATSTKPDAATPMGIEGLAAIRAAFDLPILAIGGIGPDNAEAVVRAGADGLAVISCVVGADDVAAAVHALRARVLRAST